MAEATALGLTLGAPRRDDDILLSLSLDGKSDLEESSGDGEESALSNKVWEGDVCEESPAGVCEVQVKEKDAASQRSEALAEGCVFPTTVRVCETESRE